jgi:hypothetical protein
MKKQPLQKLQCRIISIPKGQMKIARSFNCGLRPVRDKAPKGRLEWENVFSRPFGTRCVRFIIPPLKRRAIVSRHFVTFASIEFCRSLKRLIQLNLLLLLLISSAAAQDSQPQEASPQQRTKILRVYDWKDLAQQNQLSGGEVISMDEIPTLKIENTNNTPLEVSLLTITNSSLIKKIYYVSCETKYENVEAPYRFDANSPIGGSLKLFCRPVYELTKPGPIIHILGTSNWTNCTLTVEQSATQIVLKLILPQGNGIVYLRPIKLLGVVGSWWSENEAPWVGGIGGPVIGCFGGLLGWLSGKGKARRLVLAIWKFWIMAGILFLIAAVIALVTGQPFYVSMPLLIFGIVPITVFGILWPTAKKRYDDFEIRRMTSVDTMGS